MLLELGMSLHEPVLFREDNQACINMATNFMTTKRTKHIDICHHVIRYWCRDDIIDFAYTDTSGQLADMMTKGKGLVGGVIVFHNSDCLPDCLLQTFGLCIVVRVDMGVRMNVRVGIGV